MNNAGRILRVVFAGDYAIVIQQAPDDLILALPGQHLVVGWWVHLALLQLSHNRFGQGAAIDHDYRQFVVEGPLDVSKRLGFVVSQNDCYHLAGRRAGVAVAAASSVGDPPRQVKFKTGFLAPLQLNPLGAFLLSDCEEVRVSVCQLCVLPVGWVQARVVDLSLRAHTDQHNSLALAEALNLGSETRVHDVGARVEGGSRDAGHRLTRAFGLSSGQYDDRCGLNKL